ncbi:MAG: hypothetical protein LUQ11_14110 [Methylococcaceae bacterium]|nr:hypothetical protein [Methylococcaceae bacterium]
MSYGVQQNRRFACQYKKLYDNIAADADAAVGVFADNPLVNARKAILALYWYRSFTAKASYTCWATLWMTVYA